MTRTLTRKEDDGNDREKCFKFHISTHIFIVQSYLFLKIHRVQDCSSQCSGLSASIKVNRFRARYSIRDLERITGIEINKFGYKNSLGLIRFQTLFYSITGNLDIFLRFLFCLVQFVFNNGLPGKKEYEHKKEYSLDERLGLERSSIFTE